MGKKETKSSIKNLFLFLLLIIITFYIIFKDQNPKDIISILRHADLKFVFIAIRFYDFVLYV